MEHMYNMKYSPEYKVMNYLSSLVNNLPIQNDGIDWRVVDEAYYENEGIIIVKTYGSTMSLNTTDYYVNYSWLYY